MKTINFYRFRTIKHNDQAQTPLQKYESMQEQEREQKVDTTPDQNGEEDKELFVEDVVSWNYQTHPEGAGPSHMIYSIRYNYETKLMTVTMRHGGSWEYENVEKDLVIQFVQSDSKGRFWLQHFRIG